MVNVEVKLEDLGKIMRDDEDMRAATNPDIDDDEEAV